MAARESGGDEDSLDAIDAKIRQLESKLAPDCNHGDDDEHDVQPPDYNDRADAEHRTLEQAMNKDSTGIIKLPPKYLNDSQRKPKSKKPKRQMSQKQQPPLEEPPADRDDLAEALRLQYLKLSEEIQLLKLVESLRKKVRRALADKATTDKTLASLAFREDKKDENDLAEQATFEKLNKQRPRVKKTDTDQARTYKLLSRGIPTHFYKNLNKSQN